MVAVQTCADGTAFFQALLDSMVNMTTSQALTVSQDFVSAADTVGIGACVSLAVFDEQTGEVVYKQQVHTSVHVPDSAA